MGNGSCCSGYSTVDEVKIESIHAPSTRRQQHEVAEESFMQEISIEISPLKSKDKTQEDCREKTSDYTIEKTGGVSKFQRVKVLSASKNLVRDKNGGMKLLSIIQKSAVGNICEYSRCVKALQGGSGEGLYTPDEVFEDNFSLYVVSQVPTGENLLESYIREQKCNETEAFRYIYRLVEVVSQSEIQLCFINPYEIYIDSGLDSIKIVSFAYTPTIFQSPEQLQSVYSDKGIVWSLGVLAYIMLCGKIPFRSNQESSIIKGQFDFSGKNWNNLSAAAKSLIMKMLTVNSDKRISFVDFFNDSYFTRNIKNGGSSSILKILTGYLETCKTNEAKREIIGFCMDLRVKLAYLRENSQEDIMKRIAEIELLDDEVGSTAMEAYKSQQKLILHTIVNNFMAEIGCKSVLLPEIANALIAEAGFPDSDSIENSITVLEFCEFLLSLIYSA